jgi:hypothetical protein
MSLAMSHDAVPDRPVETHERSAANQRRLSTTATLLAVAVGLILAKGHLLEAKSPSHNAAVAQNTGTAPVTIVAPEFCKDQTWPYIDSRCLRRVDNPAPVAPQATVPPATTAASAPSGGSAKTVAVTPPTAATTVATYAPPPATNAPAAAPPPRDTRDQVIQSAFPAPAPDTRTYPATNAYTRASNSSQRRRSEHWNNQSGFFGFRF